MEFIARIAEQRIRQAEEEGLFDNLPGKGKPLKLEDDSDVPEELRMTFKILKKIPAAFPWRWKCEKKSIRWVNC